MLSTFKLFNILCCFLLFFFGGCCLFVFSLLYFACLKHLFISKMSHNLCCCSLSLRLVCMLKLFQSLSLTVEEIILQLQSLFNGSSECGVQISAYSYGLHYSPCVVLYNGNSLCLCGNGPNNPNPNPKKGYSCRCDLNGRYIQYLWE